MPSFYIGIDLHHTVIQVCVLDPKGDPIEERRFLFEGLEEGLEVVDFIESFGRDIRVSVEALGLNRWFVNACKDRSIDILVCDPRMLDQKSSAGRRTSAMHARSRGSFTWATWTDSRRPTIRRTKSTRRESCSEFDTSWSSFANRR